MHVAVILRMVPDIKEELEIDSSGRDIDRQWIGMGLCEFDDHALEEAILLKERSGAKVTAFALAGDGADRLLQTAIARGADSVVKIQHGLEDVFNTAEVAACYVQAIHKAGAEIVMTGVMAPDDVLGQLAGYIGGSMDVPALSAVTGVTASAGQGGLQVRQEYSGGRSALIEIAGPVVVGVQSASQPPRYLAGSKLRQAASAPIGTFQASAVATGTSAEITAMSIPEMNSSVVMLDGDVESLATQIVNQLVERSLVGE